MNPLNPTVQRFPLVARARPACPPLHERIRQLGDLAKAAARPDGDRLARAASVHNKAALIASDCGLPELARSLCWQQFDLYQPARPIGAHAARFALEPLVNLGRLMIRDDDGKNAYKLLHSLYHAVKSQTDTLIDGRDVSFRGFTAHPEDHRTLCQWLWTVLLGDGTRALVAAGQWDQALARAQERGGIGQRLLDGRQVAVLARYVAGDPLSALALLNESRLSEAWEQPVGGCLTLLCLTSQGQPTDAATADTVKHYLALGHEPELVVFRTRLGIAILDLAADISHRYSAQAAARLVNEATTAADGYVARDVLQHTGCRSLLTDTQQRTLAATVEGSGLGRGTIPTSGLTDLRSAIAQSEAATAETLAVQISAS